MDSSFNLAKLSILAGLIVFAGLFLLIYTALRLLDEPSSKKHQDTE